jgi:hypothetical protein
LEDKREYKQIRHLSQVDPNFDLYKVLTMNSHRGVGEGRTAVKFSNWQAVEDFHEMQRRRAAARGKMGGAG